jgi:thiamine biosynthesis protein ThiS
MEERHSRLTPPSTGGYMGRTMQVKLNGEIREIPEGTSVAGLLAHLGVKAQRVAVEVNEAVVTKDRYDGHTLRAGDSVEIVAFVGGG